MLVEPLWASTDRSTLMLTRGDDERGAAMAGKFEVYQDKADQYRFRLKAGNGREIVASGKSYTTRADAKRGVTAMQTAAAGATVVDIMRHDQPNP